MYVYVLVRLLYRAAYTRRGVRPRPTRVASVHVAGCDRDPANCEMLHAAVMLLTCITPALASMSAESIQLSAGSSVQLRHGGLCLVPATSQPREK